MKTNCWGVTGPSNKTEQVPHAHHRSQKLCTDHFRNSIPKDCWAPNSPDINPLDYSIWDEIVQSMDRGKVTNKTKLTYEIKHSVAKVKKDHVLHSALDFTVRLRLLLKNGGDYIR